MNKLSFKQGVEMNRLSNETIKQATVGKMMTTKEVSNYSPQEIREAISGRH